MKSNRFAEIWPGIRDVVPIMIGAVPFGILFGALASESDLGIIGTVLMSLLVYSGTMQIIGLNMITMGTSLPLIAFASLIVSSRHAFYSAALTPHVGKLSIWWRLILSYGMTDQIYVLAERRYAKRDEASHKHWYVLSTSAVLFAAWFVSTCIGYASGGVLKQFEQIGLDFALCGTYVALVAATFSDFRAIAAGLSAGLIALGLFDLPYQGGLFIAILVGIIIGLSADRLFPVKEPEKAEAAAVDARRED